MTDTPQDSSQDMSQDALQWVTEAVRRLVDQDDIKRVLFDYAYYLDLNDTEGMLSLFTADCVVAYGRGHGAHGVEAYRETLQSDTFGVGAFFAATSHHVSNVAIDFVDRDTAEVRSVVYAWHRYNRERPDGVLMGHYRDVVVRTGEGWRIKRRELETVGTESYHARDEALDYVERRAVSGSRHDG